MSQWYENVDIKISAHGEFLERPSTGTLTIERLESITIKISGSNTLCLFWLWISHRFCSFWLLV